MLDLKVATPQLMINYAALLERNQWFEESFKTYEKAVAVFKWPAVQDIWLMYLSKFTQRYGGRKLERARDLFEQALTGCPPKSAKLFFLLYAQLEEDYGLARHALGIYDRACQECDPEDRPQLYTLYIAKTAEFFGMVRTREIYERAIVALPDSELPKVCSSYAGVERALGEVDRARGIYTHGAQFAPPDSEKDFWTEWRAFEVQHGNVDTFREMLRVKRSVEAQYSQVHFNSSNISDVLSTNPMEEAEAAEQKEQALEKRKQEDDFTESKRQRLYAKDNLSLKERSNKYIEAKKFTGSKPGYVFKLGSLGLGYYEDKPADAPKAPAAAANEEEIDIDLDLDLDFEEAPVPAAVFGKLTEEGGSGSAGSSGAAESSEPMGALARFKAKQG